MKKNVMIMLISLSLVFIYWCESNEQEKNMESKGNIENQIQNAWWDNENMEDVSQEQVADLLMEIEGYTMDADFELYNEYGSDSTKLKTLREKVMPKLEEYRKEIDSMREDETTQDEINKLWQEIKIFQDIVENNYSY